MEKNLCSTCFKPKATLACGLCSDPICKYCARFLEEGSFAFLTKKPPELLQNTFCGPCFDSKISDQLDEYNSTVERAKEVQIFTKEQFKETRFIKRDEDPVKIEECDDRDELVMRLAFAAALRGKDGVVDVEIQALKVRKGSYQTTRYSGTGIPAEIRKEKLVRDRSFASKPN